MKKQDSSLNLPVSWKTALFLFAAFWGGVACWLLFR